MIIASVQGVDCQRDFKYMNLLKLILKNKSINYGKRK